jgi:7-cyano-7-deazaguanine synthase
MRKVVIGLSGGLDSATLLGLLLEQEYTVHCCSFYYGSKHNAYERLAVSKIMNYYKEKDQPVVLHTFNLEDVFKDFTSNLLKSGGEIPEGHYESANMIQTVVPGRNMIFASIMAGLAESIKAEAVALGVHTGDHAVYPDCRPIFISSLDIAVENSTEGKVKVIAPLQTDDKTSIIHRGLFELNIPVPYHLTRTCYKDQELSCAKCGSCTERLEAFHNLGIEDPIEYE